MTDKHKALLPSIVRMFKSLVKEFDYLHYQTLVLQHLCCSDQVCGAVLGQYDMDGFNMLI